MAPSHSPPQGEPTGFAAALAAGPLVLDGGLAQRLQDQGCDLSGDLWTARTLADAPDQVAAAHTAYLRAGARVLLTASYQVSFEAFARRGTDAAATAWLLRRSVRLARDAARQSARRAWVAASVGPYGAARADGGEYRGRYGRTVAELTRFHRPRVAALAAAGPDVLALETVPDVDEAVALLRAVEGCEVPVWLSYTVADGLTRAGQSLADAFAVAAGNDQVVAVGVNCCDPAEVVPALRVAVATTGLPGVAYPNSGERWDATRGWHGPVTFAPEHAASEYRAAGARLVGGCCRVGPGRIARLADALRPGRPVRPTDRCHDGDGPERP